MAIALDSTSQNTASGTQLTISHTIGSGANRLLVVGFAVEGATDAAAQITGVTYNSVAMTSVRTDDTNGGTGFTALSGIYYMDEANLPSAGTYNIVISTSSADELSGGGVSVTGAGQTGPEANNGANNPSSGSTSSVGITTSTDDAWIFDAVASGNAITFTETSPQTQRWEQTASSSGGAGSTKTLASAGATTMEWTFVGTSNRDAISAAAWAPAPTTTYEVVGVVKDTTGTPVNGADVYLFMDNGDDTFTDALAHTVSAGSGNYTFGSLIDNSAAYHVQAKLDGTPHTFDCTDHVIQPTVE